MSNMFKVIEVEGKGLRCIATTEIEKGSVILNENPQIPANAEAEQMGSSKWIKSLLKSFRKMSKANQIEYMTLRNKSSEEIINRNLDLKSKICKIEKNLEKAKDIFQICCIYVSYRMYDGFRIKTSGFKHSCQPNAVTVQKHFGSFQVRAIANIKAGQEINLNLCIDPFYGFKNKKQRQKSLLNAPPFVLCSCDLCENDVDINANAFRALIQEAEELTLSRWSLENCRKEVKCFKKMYKIGKTEKIQDYFLYYKILKRACSTASYGYLLFQAIDLKKEAEDLMKAMEKCGENLGIDATFHVDDGNTRDGWTLFQPFMAILVLFIVLVFGFLFNCL